MKTNSYPLSWPAGWPRTAAPESSRFGERTPYAALEQLKKELILLGAQDINLSSNFALGAAPKDKGVCVYFILKGKNYAMPCDKWNRVEDNLWALAKHIESLRGQERWGVGTIERAFAGYVALLTGSIAQKPWWKVLGVNPDASPEKIQSHYRSLAASRHPDIDGGSNELMAELNGAYDEAKLERGIV